jgi:hypothetical protein
MKNWSQKYGSSIFTINTNLHPLNANFTQPYFGVWKGILLNDRHSEMKINTTVELLVQLCHVSTGTNKVITYVECASTLQLMILEARIQRRG